MEDAMTTVQEASDNLVKVVRMLEPTIRRYADKLKSIADYLNLSCEHWQKRGSSACGYHKRWEVSKLLR
jgi:hypothetical protein